VKHAIDDLVFSGRPLSCDRHSGVGTGAGPCESDRSAADLHHVSGDLHSLKRNRRLREQGARGETARSASARYRIGKAHIGIGRVHRGKLDKPAPNSVAEHDQISEVYHVISGSGTLVLGPDIVNRQRRPATMRTVVEFNGPGNNGSEVRDGIAYEIKAGDVVVIPAGTGHWFTHIDDHIDYLMVRIDPDKVTPLKSEAQSQDYLSKPAPRGE
jgi:mannose-6-phosphate isomerase-like protein (cupin superfamily)